MIIRLRRVGDSNWQDYEMDNTIVTSQTPTSDNQAPAPSPEQSVDMIDMSQAIQHEGPDFTKWKATAKLISIVFDDNGINVQFSKRNDTDNKNNTWPDIIPNAGTQEAWTGPIYYSLGMAMKIGNEWHVAAPIQCWRSEDSFGGPPGLWANNQVSSNWFYSQGRWDVMCRQPQANELVGFFVIAGSVRLGSVAISVQERSNVIVIPFPDKPSIWRA